VITVDKLIYLLPVLGCAVMMGLMMLMMRGNDTARTQSDPSTQEEIAVLRAEIATLRTQQTRPIEPVDRDTRP
jgi:flagellar basal body-associated protein FliL